jgi:Tol biopolymer transport system component/DNA-binding winged helix-turn-helix (wHTH) protein
MTEHKSLVFRFDDVEVREREFLLIKAGEALPVEPKAFRVLLFLLRNPGRLVTKDEVLGAVWNDCAASDNSLTRSIATLRRLLNDDTHEPRYIATVPTVGYRFLCDVTVTNGFPGSASSKTDAEKVDSGTEANIESKKEDAIESIRGRWSRRRLIALGLTVVAIVVAGFLLRRVVRDRASPTSNFASAGATATSMRVTPLTDLPGWAGHPALSPDGEKLAFIANNETPKMDLYVQLVGGDRPLQLTHTHSGFLCCTNWSPDGREIAFGRCDDHGGAVYVVPALGGPERKLTDVVCVFPDAGHPQWTADGRSLVLADQCPPGGPPGIVRFSLATGEKQCLHSPPAGDVGDVRPGVSPDQKTVAFLKMPNADMTELYTVPLSGGAVRQMTADGHSIGSLMWSADGHRIVFDSDRNGSSRVWQVPATGGSIQAEVEYPEVGSLSRDGRRLAYKGSSGRMSGCSTTIWRAELSRPGGSVLSQERVLTPADSSGGVHLSSDRQIAYQSGRLGPTQIWKSDADGSNRLQMTFFDNRGFPGTPRWSPDDKWIAFDYHDPMHAQIYRVDSEGRNLHRITSGNYENVVPGWSRDGASVYFASNRTGGWQVWKHALATGAETQVTRHGGFAAFESYDAKTVYYSKFTGGGIWSVPVNGGEEQHLTDALHLGDWGNFTVTETGLYLVDSSTEPGPTILYYNFQNRRTTPVVMLKQNARAGTSNLSSSRDGRTILYAQFECKGSILMAERVP